MTIAARDFRELRIDCISRDFGQVNALRDVSITVRRGEFIALLGPSGCGKSTALNCLAGLLSLSSGAIWLDETRIDHLRPEARGFGMVFQNYALFPHMTVRKNIGFGLQMQKRPRTEIERRVDEVLNLVRLRQHSEKLPGQISGGQQQRVAIARAIVVEPPLVLMDEPLSNLDAKLRLDMRSEIRRIHQSIGSATIYVTHDQDEALSLADRIVVLRDGQVRQIGTPTEFYAAPASADVAEFMGFRNILPATLEHAGDGQGGGRILLEGASMAAHPLPGVPAGPALAAIRPEDLTALPGAPIEARVETAEYRGRDFYGTARTAAGTELFFRSDSRLSPGESVRLGAEAGRVLVYPL